MLTALTGVLAGLLSAYLTPLMRQGALRLGILDHPDGRLKRQAEPVPYLGGVAVYLAFLLAVSLLHDYSRVMLGLLLAATIVVALGLFDDFKAVTPFIKLLGQLVAVAVLIKAGVRIQIVMLPEPAALALSVLWLVGMINAVNILDVSDGLAASVSLVAGAALCVVALLNGHDALAILAAALVGALAGFVPYNLSPARIYLGDTGSLLLGLLLGSLALVNHWAVTSRVALLAPLAILVVPLFDTGFCMLARLGRGASPFVGSPDHFALRLRQRGWSATAVATLATLIGLAGALLGVANLWLPAAVAAPLYGAFGLALLAAALWLWRRAPAPRGAP